MRFAFDLWSYDDVVEHAEAILERLRAGNDALRRRLAGGEGRGLPTLGRVGETLVMSGTGAMRRPRMKGATRCQAQSTS